MASGKQSLEEDIKQWSDLAECMCRLKMCIEQAQAFRKKLAAHMSKQDIIDISQMNLKYEEMYWKYWNKLVNRIRGV